LISLKRVSQLNRSKDLEAFYKVCEKGPCLVLSSPPDDFCINLSGKL
jgi:hypothetical protein